MDKLIASFEKYSIYLLSKSGLLTLSKFVVNKNYERHKKVERTKWTTTLNSDPMGTVTFYFSDPVIKGYQYYPGFDIYNGYSVGTGYIDIMLLPRPI